MRSPSDHSGVPTVACFNQAKTALGVDFDALLAAMQMFVDEHFAPVWGTSAKLVTSTGFLKGSWALAFLENAGDAELEGYHDVTPEGLPMAKVFVRTTLEQKDLVSVAASHELVEMLVDPGVNLYSSGPRKNRLYDYEAADPVEDLVFHVAGIPMTDFVYPSYFETFHKKGSTPFDHMGKLTQPFELDKGGYQSYWIKGKRRNHGARKPRRSASKEKIGEGIAAAFATRWQEDCQRLTLSSPRQASNHGHLGVQNSKLSDINGRLQHAHFPGQRVGDNDGKSPEAIAMRLTISEAACMRLWSCRRS